MKKTDDIRYANLLTIFRELEVDGVTRLHHQADVLGTTEGILRLLVAGQPMSDALARELEWAAQKPAQWMDDSARRGHPH